MRANEEQRVTKQEDTQHIQRLQKWEQNSTIYKTLQWSRRLALRNPQLNAF